MDVVEGRGVLDGDWVERVARGGEHLEGGMWGEREVLAEEIGLRVVGD